MTKEYFKNINLFLTEESKKYTVYPKKIDSFNAFNVCQLNNVKAVVLGQDPYHSEGQAHGLSFSVQKGIRIPPSLRNIFKELKADLGINPPADGYLQSWAERGVLLLNSILTVRKGLPGSHKDCGWQTFTDNTIKLLNLLDRPIVFILWGAFAKSKKELITNNKHLILEAAHPSPFSAHNGFFGCKHFSKTNEFLIKNDIKPIDWNIR